MEIELTRTDVLIMGAGLAGVATAIHLARAGLQVVCIEAFPDGGKAVGESLDWSAPELLAELGLPPDQLLGHREATWKRHVVLRMADGASRDYIPSEWLGRPPWNVQLNTLHLDREALRRSLYAIATDAGVLFVTDRVVTIDCQSRRITGVMTEGGRRMTARWYVDASGLARLLPRRFNLPFHEYGPSKVAIWSYFPIGSPREGTALHPDGTGGAYMSWVWEIPINPTTISVGYVIPGNLVREQRQQGKTVEEIYRNRLSAVSGFKNLLAAKALSVHTVGFRCRVHRTPSGPNWIVVGESAAMVDPMTSNGVTAAIRHAREAARLLVNANDRQSLPHVGTALYNRRVHDLASFFNCGIEKVIYQWPIRERIGLLNAGDLYTIPAWTMNLVYSRMQPQGVLSTFWLCGLLSCLRAAVSAGYWLCRRWSAPSSSYAQRAQ